MTERIRDNQIEYLVARLCSITGRTYQYTGSYGMYEVQRIGNKDVLSVDWHTGLMSKRALYDWLNAHIQGISLGMELERKKNGNV